MRRGLVRGAALACAAFLCAAGVRAAVDVVLPAAPEGFAWERMVEVKGALLRPSGWHFRREQRGATLLYYVTKEPAGTAHRTGLTVNVHRGADRRFGALPSELALACRQRLQRLRPDAGGGGERVKGLVIERCELVDTTGLEAVHLRVVWIANDATGTLYALVFEAPESEWSAVAPLADGMLRGVVVDDEV